MITLTVCYCKLFDTPVQSWFSRVCTFHWSSTGSEITQWWFIIRTFTLFGSLSIYVGVFFASCKEISRLMYKKKLNGLNNILSYLYIKWLTGIISNPWMNSLTHTIIAVVYHSAYKWNKHAILLYLTINLLNSLNGIIHLPFLGLSIFIFRDIEMKTWNWSAYSIEPGKTAWMCI